jgi:Protein of unknown function (DUF1566)
MNYWRDSMHSFSKVFRSIAMFAIAIACVSSADAQAPAGRYTVNNGQVYDTKTKLTWQQAASASASTLVTAYVYCDLSSSADWRVPTVKELQTLLDFTVLAVPFIDQTAFAGTPAQRFWSASLEPSSGDQFVVDFGSPHIISADPTDDNFVRCVR